MGIVMVLGALDDNVGAGVEFLHVCISCKKSFRCINQSDYANPHTEQCPCGSIVEYHEGSSIDYTYWKDLRYFPVLSDVLVKRVTYLERTSKEQAHEIRREQDLNHILVESNKDLVLDNRILIDELAGREGHSND